MKPRAFTLNKGTRLDSILTPIQIRQSWELCQDFNLLCQQVDVLALWDTGSTESSISRGLAQQLGLKAVDMCQVLGIGGPQPSKVYLIDIFLPSNVIIPDVRVAEFLDNGTFSVIIGMDIITLGDLAISNKDEKTVVSFRIPPSDNPVDFVKDIGADEPPS